jgi:AAA domain
MTVIPWATTEGTTTPAPRFYTARELANLGDEEVRYIAAPYVAEGLITELDGKIKQGKTTLTLQLVRAVLTRNDFLDNPTQYTPVVYLTEQSHQSFKPQLRKAGLLDRDDLVILHRWDLPSGFTWPMTVAAATSKAAEIGAKLIIVDTLSQFAGLQGDAENDSGSAYTALEPLQRAAQQGLAVLLPRHERKGGGDVGDSARGSSAFGGAVDIILALQRPQGRAETVRVLHAIGRTDPPPAITLDYHRDEGLYVSLGSETAVRQQEAKSAILDRLPSSPETGVSEKAILDLVVEKDRLKRGTARDGLRELLESGAAQRKKIGRAPFKYWRSGPGTTDNIETWEGPFPDDETT